VIAVMFQRFRLLHIRLVIFRVPVVILQHAQNVIHFHAADKRERFPVMNQAAGTTNFFSAVERLPLFDSCRAVAHGFERGFALRFR